VLGLDSDILSIHHCKRAVSYDHDDAVKIYIPHSKHIHFSIFFLLVQSCPALFEFQLTDLSILNAIDMEGNNKCFYARIRTHSILLYFLL
jgi:hypothetical protein